MIIIGITGTNGAGKGTVVDFIVQNHGFRHLHIRKYLIEHLKKEDHPVNRDSMFELANQLRKKNGPSFLAEELFKQALDSGENCIIESLRAVAEIESLREKGDFYLIAVDASPIKRYKRILKRDSETDRVSFEKFLEDEKREMDSNDPNKQNLKRCIELADYKIVNDGTIEDLDKKVSSVINEIKKGSK